MIKTLTKKFTMLAVYICILFVIPFFPHLHELYRIPIVLSIVLASLLFVSQPLAGQNDSDLSFYVVMYGFMASLLLPVVDFVYLHRGFAIAPGIGFVISLAGLCFRIYAIDYLGKQFTSKVKIVEEHELIDSGPYKHIRHPSYTGTLVMLLGNALIYGSWIGIAGIALIMFPAYLYRTKVEEQTLTEFFGQKYADYINRTRPFI